MNVYWFRKSLRLHDNPALVAALQKCHSTNVPLFPIFCLDPHFISNSRVGVLRWIFLFESLRDLDTQLRAKGSRLFVVRGFSPLEMFTKLFAGFKVDSVFLEQDTEPYAIKRDAEIKQLATSQNVRVEAMLGHTLYDPEVVIAANKGKTPLRYQSFLKILESLPEPEPALDGPLKFPTISAVDLDKFHAVLGSDNDFEVPNLEQLGIEEEAPTEPGPHRGGETMALERMRLYLLDKKKVVSFEKPKTRPTAFDPPDTTVLSPYLKFGCLSARLFYHELQDVLKSSRNHTLPPVSLLGQLLWRDFYYTAAYGTPNFHQIEGNSICLKVDWKCLNNDKEEGAELLHAWTYAKTGFPWIDAAMTQLRTEGWIHHLARHAVACFLTRGDLYISWERGAEVFDELLLDADPSLNYGNWMWLSASAFFYQYFRVYSPISFAQKSDPKGAYVRRYIPALCGMPDKFIYEPWKAPLSVQKAAKCIVGKDYPKPIVDHNEARKSCLGLIKLAYDRGLNGDGSSRKSAHSTGKKSRLDEEEDDDDEGTDGEEDGSSRKPASKKSKK